MPRWAWSRANAPDPVGGEFRLTFDEMNYGLELKSALDNLVTRVPLQDVKIVCHRHSDPARKRRQPGRSSGEDCPGDPRALPPEETGYDAHRPGTFDGMDPDTSSSRPRVFCSTWSIRI